MIQDAAYPVEATVLGMASERIGRAQNYYFTKGTGSGQPKGFAVAAGVGKTLAAVNALTYEELIDLLGSAWKAAKRDENGFALLSEVGNIAGNRSSFDVRNHGFKRLSDLFRSDDHFKVELREGRLYVKRVR